MFTANELRRQTIGALNQGSAPAAILASRITSTPRSELASSESTLYGILRGLENDGKVVATAVAHPVTGEPVWVYSLAGRPTPGGEAVLDISADLMKRAQEVRRDPDFVNWFDEATEELAKVERERLFNEVSLHAGVNSSSEDPLGLKRLGDWRKFRKVVRRFYLTASDLNTVRGLLYPQPEPGRFAPRDKGFILAIALALLIQGIYVAIGMSAEEWRQLWSGSLPMWQTALLAGPPVALRILGFFIRSWWLNAVVDRMSARRVAFGLGASGALCFLLVTSPVLLLIPSFSLFLGHHGTGIEEPFLMGIALFIAISPFWDVLPTLRKYPAGMT